MKLVIFDGSFKTTPFINRLIKGLVVRDVELYVLGFNEEVYKKIKGITYIGLGSNQSYVKLLFSSLKLGLSSGLIKTLKALVYITKKDRKRLQKQNLDIVLHKIKPDIIHIQWPSLLPWLEPYFNKNKFKIILSQRGSQNNIRPITDTDFNGLLLKYYPFLDGIHSVSKAIQKKGRNFYFQDTVIEEVVYTGLNLKDLGFVSPPERNEKLKILSVGRVHWVKGYDTSIKVMAILKKQNVSFEYDIIGGQGDEELSFLINDLDLNNEVRLLPKVEQQKVYAKMKQANLLLLPSIEEGLANVAVEAMALGTLVISSDCGGMKELITDGKEGWTVPVRDPEAMANQILTFKNLSVEELKTIQLAARNKVEQQHSEEQMMEGMLELYKRVIG